MSPNPATFWGPSGGPNGCNENSFNTGDDTFQSPRNNGNQANQGNQQFSPGNAASGNLSLAGISNRNRAFLENNSNGNIDFTTAPAYNGSGSSSQTPLNPASESWVPSAQQALTNALQMGGQVNDNLNNTNGPTEGPPGPAAGLSNGGAGSTQPGIGSVNGASGVSHGTIGHAQGYTSPNHGFSGPAHGVNGHAQGVAGPSHGMETPTHRGVAHGHPVAGPAYGVAGPNSVASPTHRAAGHGHPVAGPVHRVAGPTHQMTGHAQGVAGPSPEVASPRHRVTGHTHPVTGTPQAVTSPIHGVAGPSYPVVSPTRGVAGPPQRAPAYPGRVGVINSQGSTQPAHRASASVPGVALPSLVANQSNDASAGAAVPFSQPYVYNGYRASHGAGGPSVVPNNETNNQTNEPAAEWNVPQPRRPEHGHSHSMYGIGVQSFVPDHNVANETEETSVHGFVPFSQRPEYTGYRAAHGAGSPPVVSNYEPVSEPPATRYMASIPVQVSGSPVVAGLAQGADAPALIPYNQVEEPFAARYVPPAPPNSPRSGPSQVDSFQRPPAAAFVNRADGPVFTTSVHAHTQNQGGLPQSHSFQSMPTSNQLLSPGPTPQHLNGVYGNGLLSPETTGRLTEPRNYAPRTSGQPAVHAPPPKFGLEVNHDSPHRSAQDPFVSSAPSRALVPYQAPVTNQAPVPYQAPAAIPASTSQGSLIRNTAVQNFLPPQGSSQLMQLTNGLTTYPSMELAMDPSNFPFVDGPRQAQPQNHGVVKLKNIPFATKRSEIIAFLGRNSKILNDSEEPVHIIMERATSKTMDAYVEFHTMSDAMKSAERHHNNALQGRISRLGERPIEVELSSQGSLMRDLFPIARGVFWDGPNPKFKPFSQKEPWENFKGFISTEEMTMLVKHVEVPHRSPFSKECPQRPYECLISTLRKFPWYMTECITITQRQSIFTATCELIRLLRRAIEKNDDILNLNTQLYKRVISAAMMCKGFTTRMKDDIAWSVDMTDIAMRAWGQPRFAYSWLHQYAIVPKPGIQPDVLEWYIDLIRQQTQREVLARPLTNRTVLQEKAEKTDMYWGYFWAEVNYVQGPQFDHMTLAHCAHKELSAIERILSRALQRN
ncbi:hypothetical protein QQX98_012005 [Neonectria punicea]|uniref:RRM domain-containing protein n=1 Tax=Neonectria punicea TaxID=979145 RepID=A0ABR1GK81_9HYPO